MQEIFSANKVQGNDISKDYIKRDLLALGVQKGDHLAIGLSFKSMGKITGGPDTFIDALIEFLGPDGTLMMNTYTSFFNYTEVRLGWVDYVFDPQTSKATTGVVPEIFRKRRGVRRSSHPATSVAAKGKFAKYLTEGHDENAAAYSPYQRLAKINGKYLAIGIGDKLAGLRHQGQYEAGLLDVVPWKPAVNFKDGAGATRIFIFKDKGGCVTKLPMLVQSLRQSGIVTDGNIGMAEAVLVPVKEAIEQMKDILIQRPEVNLCDNLFCLWCREVERRMNLYEKIGNPKFFQRNMAGKQFVKLMNLLWLADDKSIAILKRLVKKVSKFAG